MWKVGTQKKFKVAKHQQNFFRVSGLEETPGRKVACFWWVSRFVSLSSVFNNDLHPYKACMYSLCILPFDLEFQGDHLMLFGTLQACSSCRFHRWHLPINPSQVDLSLVSDLEKEFSCLICKKSSWTNWLFWKSHPAKYCCPQGVLMTSGPVKLPLLQLASAPVKLLISGS